VIASPVESLCVHGDTPGAVEMARRIRAALDSAGVRLAPFVPLL
jgi:5-oxoprolinase (ATP-hydrolysing) subunit A